MSTIDQETDAPDDTVPVDPLTGFSDDGGRGMEDRRWVRTIGPWLASQVEGHQIIAEAAQHMDPVGQDPRLKSARDDAVVAAYERLARIFRGDVETPGGDE